MTLRTLAFSLIAAAVSLVGSALPARAIGTYSVSVVRVATPPVLDGTLGDPVCKTGAHVQLGWDSTFQRAATETTDAYLLADDRYLYIGWDVEQTEPITATVHTNDTGLGADDIVRVFLWPGGDTGFEYFFAANAIGTRYANSSENAAFAPEWTVVSARNATGYTVTERIPLAVLRGDGRSAWRIQFDRRVVANNGQMLVWSHDPAQRNDDDVTFVGAIQGMRGASAPAKAKPRLNLYALGAVAAQSLGGSTSRVGADLALPITATASFLATFHPDYSNVELDQQSISPTAFQRQYQEVRPFFTQGASFYNNFNCNDCVAVPFLYTPSIPTPRDGFAVEGVQGQAHFAAFDSLSNGRTDTAQAVALVSPDHKQHLIFQRSGVDWPGVHDVASYGQYQIGNAHNFSVYATVGQENGTFVTDPREGRYREYGINLYTPKSGFFAAYHDVGSQYAPFDGFTNIDDVRGPSVYTFKQWDSPKSFITSLEISQDVQRYKNRFGQWDDVNHSTAISVMTKNLFYVAYSLGAQYLLFPGTPGEFANQNGLSVSYDMASSTPTDFGFYYGRFGQGYLHTTNRDTTIALDKRTNLTLVANSTSYVRDSGIRDVQWLEKASLGFQIDPHTSFALGVRKIVGTGPTYFSTPDYLNATNLSAAFYKRFGPSELYVVYGDPNALRTKPAFIVKYILYVGAQKGT